MNWRHEWRSLLLIIGTFLVIFYLPTETTRFENGVSEAFHLARWYAREHVLLCLVPAFFIAGAIATFVSQASVMRYLGAGANRLLAYGVASVSGTVLAVCSCTVLPLFGGIYRMGAGLGPASAFLYSGPAVNILAIILTARVLGPELGVARAVGAVTFSVVIGLAMAFLFRREENRKENTAFAVATTDVSRPLWQNAAFLATMVGILVFLNWAKPTEPHAIWSAVYSARWSISAGLAVLLGVQLIAWFGTDWKPISLVGALTALAALVFAHEPMIPYAIGIVGFTVATSNGKGEVKDWFDASWGFAKQITPLLLIGVLVSGALLGRPGHEGWIPSAWVSGAVGDNSLASNLFASVVGAFMYFATLTEIPILQGLLGSGMAKGPALALLLAGPALSLPSMLVIRSFIGTRKAVVFVSLVVLLATLTGFLYGVLF